MGGIGGLVAANLGNLFVPVVLMLFAMGLYARYKDLASVKAALGMIHLAVFALIIALAFKLVDVNQLAHLRNMAIVVICFTLFVYTKIHPALIVVGAGVLGALLK